MSGLRIALVGNGRMGKVIARLAEEAGHTVLGFVGPGDAKKPQEIPGIETADAIMDFSYPGNLEALLETGVRLNLPLVIGTTGLTEEQGEAIRRAAEKIPVVWADNFSTGVTVLLRLAREAAAVLGETWDIELTETHHRMKADAPSGTAKALLRAMDPEGKHPLIYGREGRPGERGREIGVHSLRGGTVAGEHRVQFFGAMEEVELRHRADSREIFARGALTAAGFASQAKPGLYDMEDVLFGGKS